MGVGKVAVEGYTRIVNGKPVKVKPYSQQRSLMDALSRVGRRPMAASSGQYAAGRALPTSPAKRKAAKKEMATTLNAMKKQAKAAPKKGSFYNGPKSANSSNEPEKKTGPRAPAVKGTFANGPRSANSSNPAPKKTGGYEAKPLKPPAGVKKTAPKKVAANVEADRRFADSLAESTRQLAGEQAKERSASNWSFGKKYPANLPKKEQEGVVSTPPEIVHALSGINPKGRPEGAGTMADPIDVGDDLERAVTLIAEGKHIRLRQVDEVSMVLDRLAKRVEHAKKLGDKAPNFNLCLITVPGTNLFCTESKGVPRAKMPQLSGQPTEGSRAASLVNEKGEAHIEEAFRQALIDTGVKVTLKTVKASHLKASQAELDGPKVAGMSKAMEEGKVPDAPIFVTNDGYIVDGHHRWASKVAIDLKDGVLGDVDMPVEEIDLDIGAVLDFANEFALAMGIKPKGLGAAAEGVSSDSMDDIVDPLAKEAVDPLDAVMEAIRRLDEVVKKTRSGQRVPT